MTSRSSCETNGAMITQHINADLSAAASKGRISAKDKAIHFSRLLGQRGTVEGLSHGSSLRLRAGGLQRAQTTNEDSHLRRGQLEQVRTL